MNCDDVAVVVPIFTIPSESTRRRGEIRIALKRWRGRESLDVRWWAESSGQYRATMRGASIPLHHLESFASAVADALRRVQAGDGLPS